MATQKKGRATKVTRRKKASKSLQSKHHGRSESPSQSSGTSLPLLPNGYLPTDCPFKIEYLPPSKQKKKKGAKSKGKPSYPPHIPSGYRLEDPISGGSGFPIAYTVQPMHTWESLKKYKNFIISGHNYGLNQYVSIKAATTETAGASIYDDGTHWIAKVLEIRALDSDHVYLRVAWMYLPRELPGGRRPYHGGDEVIASNHMEIIEAMTVSEGVTVVHINEEDDEAIPVSSLYWRQQYSVVEPKGLSELRRDCICNGFHHPDRLLVHCENAACRIWLHEECLIEQGLLQNPAAEKMLTDGQKISESAPNAFFPPELQNASLTVADETKCTGPQSSSERHGKLEMVTRIDPRKNYEVQEATGRLIITSTIEGAQSVSATYGLNCPACGESMSERDQG